ncbi:hypothetical protein C1Y31_13415 [Pseudomonas sp. FW305-25]|nr:hypothetical protein C1Y31_13415 [Pseudomonas sp. FW305-25]PMY75089.1 hypothetical protein C1Y32_00195 [Pseudomonas sp. FW126-L8]PNA74113.1 hypothetical protein C1Y33_25525 [Pseudomonas sp. FW305-76]
MPALQVLRPRSQPAAAATGAAARQGRALEAEACRKRHICAGFSSLTQSPDSLRTPSSSRISCLRPPEKQVGALIAYGSAVQRWTANVRHAEERLWTSTFMWP